MQLHAATMVQERLAYISLLHNYVNRCEPWKLQDDLGLGTLNNSELFGTACLQSSCKILRTEGVTSAAQCYLEHGPQSRTSRAQWTKLETWKVQSSETSSEARPESRLPQLRPLGTSKFGPSGADPVALLQV